VAVQVATAQPAQVRRDCPSRRRGGAADMTL
jgi:hypothetical protein